MISRRQIRALLPYWIAVLIIGSFLPGPAKRVLGTQPGGGPPGQPAPMHRAWHLLSFGSTALLTSLAAGSSRRRVLHPVAVFVLGLSIELLQPPVFGGELEWWDIRDDGYGVLAALLLDRSNRLRRLLLADAPVPSTESSPLRRER